MCKLGHDKCKYQYILDMEDVVSQKVSIDLAMPYGGMPMGFHKWSEDAKKRHTEIIKQGDICCDCLKEKLKIK